MLGSGKPKLFLARMLANLLAVGLETNLRQESGYRKKGPGRPRRTRSPGKEGLPCGWAGAKLARKAINKTLTIRHGKYTTGVI